MKEKTIEIIFFTIIIFLIILAIYFLVKNNNTLAKNIRIKKQEEIIDNNINLGITDFDNLNPILSKNQDVQYISKLVYEPLINITIDFRLEAGLAKEWAMLDDKTYLILLNDEKKWHDASLFSAKDVEYTVNYIKGQDSIYQDNVKNIERIEVINDYTIKIHLFEKEDDFEYMLCFPIVCEKENIGTGKYKVLSQSDEIIEIADTKSSNTFTIKIYKNVKDLYNAFNNKQIDIITTKKSNYKTILGEIGYNKQKIYGRNFEYLKLNLNNKIFENQEVFEAISLAINKNEIIYKAYDGEHTDNMKAEFPLQYGSYLYDNNIKYNYDINKAKKILEDAGWKLYRKIFKKR